jgi:hypothetical protein
MYNLKTFTRNLDARSLIVAMSNRRLTDASQVLELLTFRTTDMPSSTLSPLPALLRQCFQLRFIRWLRGHGLPLQLRGYIMSEDLYDSQKDDPLVRAKILLKAVGDTDLLPTQSFHSHIEVSCVHLCAGLSTHYSY